MIDLVVDELKLFEFMVKWECDLEVIVKGKGNVKEFLINICE